MFVFMIDSAVAVLQGQDLQLLNFLTSFKFCQNWIQVWSGSRDENNLIKEIRLPELVSWFTSNSWEQERGHWGMQHEATWHKCLSWKCFSLVTLNEELNFALGCFSEAFEGDQLCNLLRGFCSQLSLNQFPPSHLCCSVWKVTRNYKSHGHIRGFPLSEDICRQGERTFNIITNNFCSSLIHGVEERTKEIQTQKNNWYV